MDFDNPAGYALTALPCVVVDHLVWGEGLGFASLFDQWPIRPISSQMLVESVRFRSKVYGGELGRRGGVAPIQPARPWILEGLQLWRWRGDRGGWGAPGGVGGGG